MSRLLVINPNTSAGVTQLLAEHVRAAVDGGWIVEAVGARFGAPYIACEASYAAATLATLDAWAARLVHGPGMAGAMPPPDAVLIGCFGDPGLLALREASPAPVTGLAEAAFIAAARHGRFAIVTGGVRWAPMLERLAYTLGYAKQLVGIRTVAPTGAALAADPSMALDVLEAACRDAAQLPDVGAIIVGGAGLAGMAAALQPAFTLPLIDSVVAGARWATQAPVQPRSRAEPGFDVHWQGLSAALAALGLQAPSTR